LPRDPFIKKPFSIKAKIKIYFSFRIELPSVEHSSQQAHQGSTSTAWRLAWRKKLWKVKERVPEEETHAHA
jgi:hypothetical protein